MISTRFPRKSIKTDLPPKNTRTVSLTQVHLSRIILLVQLSHLSQLSQLSQIFLKSKGYRNIPALGNRRLERILPVSGREKGPTCHPECREGSGSTDREILRAHSG